MSFHTIVKDKEYLHKYLLLEGDIREILKDLPSEFVHTVITSPPYWNLRDYQNENQLGQERTPEEYIFNLVNVFREMRRILRKDGVFWLNIGDSYNNESGFNRSKNKWSKSGGKKDSSGRVFLKHPYFKRKDLFGIPWMLANALQRDGWYLRCDIVWKKENPMPDGAKDRPTRGHEFLFMFTKSPKYYYDYWNSLEDSEKYSNKIQRFGAHEQIGTFRQDQNRSFEHYGKRNVRSVWSTAVSTYRGKHFSTYPPDLIRRCVLTCTSEEGCCSQCGKPYERIIEKVRDTQNRLILQDNGWRKACKCKTIEKERCIVMDPFNGTGTTGEVAMAYWQHYLGVEINKNYIDASEERFNRYEDFHRIRCKKFEELRP